MMLHTNEISYQTYAMVCNGCKTLIGVRKMHDQMHPN